MRSGKVEKKLLEPDPIFNSRLITRFINKIMSDGRKSTAQRVIYDALEEIKEASKGERSS